MKLTRKSSPNENFLMNMASKVITLMKKSLVYVSSTHTKNVSEGI